MNKKYIILYIANKLELLNQPPKYGIKLTDVADSTKLIIQNPKCFINVRFPANKKIEFNRQNPKLKGNPVLNPTKGRIFYINYIFNKLLSGLNTINPKIKGKSLISDELPVF